MCVCVPFVPIRPVFVASRIPYPPTKLLWYQHPRFLCRHPYPSPGHDETCKRLGKMIWRCKLVRKTLAIGYSYSWYRYIWYILILCIYIYILDGIAFFSQVCWVSILDESLTFPCLWPLTNAPTASVDSLWISPAARPNVEIPETAAKQRGWLSETENTQVMHPWVHLEDKIKSNQVINVRSWDDYASTNISSGHVEVIPEFIHFGV